MKPRKWIALLASLLLLVGMLPLSLSVGAEDAIGVNLLKNSDFESGDANWEKLVGTVSVVDDPTGSGHGKVMMTNENGSQTHMFQQTVSGLSAYTDYVLKFKVYTFAASGTKPGFWATLGKKTITYNTSDVTCYPMEVKTVDSSSSTRVRFTSVMASAYNTWIDVEIPFNTNKETSTTIMFSNYRGDAGQYYFDDIELYCAEDPGNDIPSDAGDLENGSFETGDATGWQTWQSTTISTAAAHDGTYGAHLKGNGSWGGMLNQTVAVERGKQYTLSFWLKVNAVGVNLQIKKNDNSGDQIDGGWYKYDLYKEWTQITYTFTATCNAIYINFCGSGKGTSEDIYVDNFICTKNDVVNDALMQNGGFETGSLSGWKNLWNSCTVSFAAGHESTYALKLECGQWQQVRQDGIAVEPYADYVLSAYVKEATNFALITKTGDDSGNIAQLDIPYSSEWTKYEMTFNSGIETEICALLIGTANGCSALIDDVTLTKVSGGDEGRTELLTDGGSSIRDTSFYQRGLAFRFSLNVSGAQIADGYTLVPNTGSLDLFEDNDDSGTLVETGAVVTNVETIGNSNMTFDSVDGRKTVKVAAQHVMDATQSSITFAVRVINIPDAHADTTIYARPYYTYEHNGEQTTVYGAIVSNSYTAILDARTDLKILAIGDDSTTDAMHHHLYDLMKSAGYNYVVLGALCSDDSTLDDHWNNAQAKNNTYAFHKNNNGQWATTNNCALLSALQDEEWDIIVIQQSASLAGVSTSYGALDRLVNWVEEHKSNPNAKIYWHMTWANDGNAAQYDDIADIAQNTAMAAKNIDGIIPTGTAIQNLRTSQRVHSLTTEGYRLEDTYGDYAAAMTWFASLTGKSLDLVQYIPDPVALYHYDVARAAAHAVYTPYAAHDLSETVLFAGSDFQPTGYDTSGIRNLLGSLTEQGYGLFDGFLMVGDYTPNNSVEESSKGLDVLDSVVSERVNFGKIYSQGNHDEAGTEGMCASGNNDPLNGTYGVFVINEDDYNAYGAGGQQVATDLNAYFAAKKAAGWGNQPIFVMSHLPLHYNYRTMKDGGAKTAQYIIDALNAASDDGFNIIFLIGHNHSGGYDDYLGGAAIYIPKGDSILVANPTNYQDAPIEAELRFTYLNAGYVAYYADMGKGADTALTMTTFRIQTNGDVIITRYDVNGVHNLKSDGKLSPSDPEYTTYTYADDRVYESSRIVGAFKDEEYDGE